MVGLAHLRHTPQPQACNALERCIRRSLPDLSAQHVPNLLWAFAQLRWEPHPKLLRGLVYMSARHLASSRGVGNGQSSHGGAADPGAQAAGGRQGAGFKPGELALLAHTCSRLPQRPGRAWAELFCAEVGSASAAVSHTW